MNAFSIRPFTPAFKNVGGLLDDVFNRSLTDFFGSDVAMRVPSINIIDEQDAYSIEVAAPGLEKADFDVKTENDVLTISMSRESEEKQTEGNFVRREFNYSSFKRSFHLPDTVDIEGIEASYERGILHVRIPKLEEDIKRGPRAISIS